MTLSITSFNATTGRVNVSLSNSNMDLLLSGTFLWIMTPCVLYVYVYVLYVLYIVCHVKLPSSADTPRKHTFVTVFLQQTIHLFDVVTV